MPCDRADALRLQAAQCRQLAAGAETAEVRRMLEQMAGDFDRHAAELEQEAARGSRGRPT